MSTEEYRDYLHHLVVKMGLEDRVEITDNVDVISNLTYLDELLNHGGKTISGLSVDPVQQRGSSTVFKQYRNKIMEEVNNLMNNLTDQDSSSNDLGVATINLDETTYNPENPFQTNFLAQLNALSNEGVVSLNEDSEYSEETDEFSDEHYTETDTSSTDLEDVEFYDEDDPEDEEYDDEDEYTETDSAGDSIEDEDDWDDDPEDEEDWDDDPEDEDDWDDDPEDEDWGESEVEWEDDEYSDEEDEYDDEYFDDQNEPEWEDDEWEDDEYDEDEPEWEDNEDEDYSDEDTHTTLSNSSNLSGSFNNYETASQSALNVVKTPNTVNDNIGVSRQVIMDDEVMDSLERGVSNTLNYIKNKTRKRGV